MPANNPDLHGMVPDKSRTALIFLDVLNDLEFAGADMLAPQVPPVANKLRALKRRARKAGIPSVYVNDNYGRWRSDFKSLIKHCIDDNTRGRELVEKLKPLRNDYFVLKPKHSGFYSTTLDVLLDYLGVENVILTGIAGNICVLFTANDAYMRDFNLYVPCDCTVSNDPDDNEHALQQMEAVLKADIRPSNELDLAALATGGKGRRKRNPDN